MRIRRWSKRLAALAALALLLAALAGCTPKGNPLPEGMDQETVLTQGREVVELLNGGDYQAVYGLLRPASQETTSPEAIGAYMQAALDKAGPYKEESEAMATGQTMKDTGEEYGTAVFYCEHEKKDVLYRIAFDQEMDLMGLEIKAR